MTPRSQHPDHTDRLAALHTRLTAAVEELATSDAWRRMLEVAARFPSYSPSNVVLIAAQLPHATHVQGIRQWNRLGRRVRKGEKGIAILAPCLYRDTDPPDRPAVPAGQATTPQERQETAPRVLRGFRIVHVWDISQVEPPGPLAPDVAPAQLTGPAPAHLWDRLVALARADGFAVERGHCGDANGYTRFDQGIIRVRDDVDDSAAVKTLAHEIGHCRSGHASRFADRYHRSVDCRGLAEIEAESIAFLVTATAGLDSSAYSVPYVTGWAGGDLTLLRDTATRVLTTAAQIESALGLSPGRSVSREAPRRTGAHSAALAVEEDGIGPYLDALMPIGVSTAGAGARSSTNSSRRTRMAPARLTGLPTRGRVRRRTP